MNDRTPSGARRWLPLICLSLLTCAMSPASAQLRRPEGASLAPRIPGERALSTDLQLSGAPRTSDYIVAVVNQEPITHNEVDKRVQRVIDSAPANARLPSLDELRRQVLNALIDEKVQLSYAQNLGMGVGEGELDTAIENIAAQNQMTMAELRERMQADGLDFDRYRGSLREQILIQRIREREVNARIQISDADVTEFLASDPAAQTESALNLAHILIKVPENASPQEVQRLQAKAADLQAKAAAGVNFSQLVKQFSDDRSTHDSGGAFGLREVSGLPEVFVKAVADIKVGQVAPVVRSRAGFHVIKLVERENAAQASYTQQRARHILLRSAPGQNTRELVDKMQGIRRQIMEGQASFAQMARQHSEDGSGAKGGELGWSSPGQFVPEFEKAVLALQPGQISEPVVSRYGVHLIQLLERREVQLSDAQRREAARSVLRERRFEPAYEEWANELRAAAYVELRDAP
jgi:peptidyl-prolyl cis-trans isomerase SurA